MDETISKWILIVIIILLSLNMILLWIKVFGKGRTKMERWLNQPVHPTVTKCFVIFLLCFFFVLYVAALAVYIYSDGDPSELPQHHHFIII